MTFILLSVNDFLEVNDSPTVLRWASDVESNSSFATKPSFSNGLGFTFGEFDLTATLFTYALEDSSFLHWQNTGFDNFHMGWSVWISEKMSRTIFGIGQIRPQSYTEWHCTSDEKEKLQYNHGVILPIVAMKSRTILPAPRPFLVHPRCFEDTYNEIRTNNYPLGR